MSSAIAIQSVVPIREKADETSEMVSQLLFGETIKILSLKEKWAEIESSDNYRGWVDRKMLFENEISSNIEPNCSWIISSPIAVIQRTGIDGVQYLSMGSLFHEYDDETEMFRMGNMTGRLISGSVIKSQWSCVAQLLATARHWLNVPYLWGGRNIMGVDCSGFIQIIFRINGIELPRDAKDQALAGRCLDTNEEILPGDLAFFSNAMGKIVHVGMIIASDRIIHCSGSVRIDILDKKGIYREDIGDYTHKLHSVVRMIDRL